MGNQSHFFLALPVANQIRLELKALQEKLRGEFLFNKWVHPQDLHITLVFLGSASFQQIQYLKKEINEVLKQHSPFSLKLTNLGTFGQPNQPRILWAGVEEQEKLFELQKDIFSVCKELGLQLDERPYSPHITLARKWVSKEDFQLEKAKQFFNQGIVETRWGSEHVVLYQTHLDRTPKYQPLKIFTL